MLATPKKLFKSCEYLDCFCILSLHVPLALIAPPICSERAVETAHSTKWGQNEKRKEKRERGREKMKRKGADNCKQMSSGHRARQHAPRARHAVSPPCTRPLCRRQFSSSFFFFFFSNLPPEFVCISSFFQSSTGRVQRWCCTLSALLHTPDCCCGLGVVSLRQLHSFYSFFFSFLFFSFHSFLFFSFISYPVNELSLFHRHDRLLPSFLSSALRCCFSFLFFSFLFFSFILFSCYFLLFSFLFFCLVPLNVQ